MRESVSGGQSAVLIRCGSSAGPAAVRPVIVPAGGLLVAAGKIPFFGKLPGEIVIKRERVTVYVPIVSILIISVVISTILFLVRK